MAKKKPKTQTCPTCNGGGTMPWGDATVPCNNCAGKGKVKA